jgi:hypothetical protein
MRILNSSYFPMIMSMLRGISGVASLVYAKPIMTSALGEGRYDDRGGRERDARQQDNEGPRLLAGFNKRDGIHMYLRMEMVARRPMTASALITAV